MNIYLELFLTFIKVNLLSTSGPASAGLIYTETVGRFITDAQYVQAFGFSSVLPGSDALQLAMYIGYNVAGIPGGLVALSAAILPPTVIILGVVSVLHRVRREAWVASFVEGLTPAISIVILFSAWKIFEKSDSGWQGWVIGAVSLVALLFEVNARVIILAAAIVGVLLFT